jgi:hypothetical protein
MVKKDKRLKKKFKDETGPWRTRYEKFLMKATGSLLESSIG